MANQHLKELKFDKDRLVYNFTVTGPKPQILIKKIIINTLSGHGPNIGVGLTRLNPMLQVTFLKISGIYMEAPISFNAYLSSYHMQPVLELDMLFPRENNWSEDEIKNFDSCTFEITYTPQVDLPLNISIYYLAQDLRLV